MKRRTFIASGLAALFPATLLASAPEPLRVSLTVTELIDLDDMSSRMRVHVSLNGKAVRYDSAPYDFAQTDVRWEQVKFILDETLPKHPDFKLGRGVILELGPLSLEPSPKVERFFEGYKFEKAKNFIRISPSFKPSLPKDATYR